MPQSVTAITPTPFPIAIKDHHQYVMLCADFFVQSTPVHHTISLDIIFRTISEVTIRSKKTIVEVLHHIINMYQTCGFHFTNVLADNKFECVCNDILPYNINVAIRLDHVSEVEQSIRTMKETVCRASNGLPFKCIPKILIMSMVMCIVTNLNSIPAENSVSSAGVCAYKGAGVISPCAQDVATLCARFPYPLRKI